MYQDQNHALWLLHVAQNVSVYKWKYNEVFLRLCSSFCSLVSAMADGIWTKNVFPVLNLSFCML